MDEIQDLREIVDHLPRESREYAHGLLDEIQSIIEPPLIVQGKPRHPDWSKTAKKWLLKESFCQACGSVKNLQVHHKKPYHLFPELELDPTNLMTLCMAPGRFCHFRAHLFNWSRWDEEVEEECGRLLRKVKHGQA